MLTYILEKIKSKLRNNERKRKGSGYVAERNITLINEDLSALYLSAITHTIIILLFFPDKEESLQQASCVLLP